MACPMLGHHGPRLMRNKASRNRFTQKAALTLGLPGVARSWEQPVARAAKAGPLQVYGCSPPWRPSHGHSPGLDEAPGARGESARACGGDESCAPPPMAPQPMGAWA